MNQIKVSAVLSYTVIFLNTFVGIFIMPLMVRKLGPSEYGLYTLMGSFIGYFMILDLGLTSTIVRYVAKYIAEEDKKGKENFLAVTIIIYSVIATILVFAGLVFYWNIKTIFGSSFTTEELSRAKQLFSLVIINVPVTLLAKYFLGIISGYENFIFASSFSVLRIVCKAIVLVALVLLGYKAVGIVLLDTVLNLLMLIASVIYAFAILKVKIYLHNFDKLFVAEMFSFSFFVFLSMITDQLYWRVGNLVLGIVAGTAAVAVYSVALQLNLYFIQCSSALSGLFLPRATQMVVSGAGEEELTDLLIKVARIQFFIIGFILGGFILFGKQFVVFWVGKDYAQSFAIAVIMMVPLAIPLTQNIGISILQAKNKHAFRAIVYLGSTIVNLAAGFVLAKYYGGIGIAISTAVFLTAGNIIINIYYHYKIGLNMPRFFKSLSKLLPAIFATVLVSFLFDLFLNNGSWIMFVTQVIIFAVIYMLFIYLFGMNEYEKSYVTKPLTRARMFILGKKNYA